MAAEARTPSACAQRPGEIRIDAKPTFSQYANPVLSRGRAGMTWLTEYMMANNNNYDSASCGPPSPHSHCSIPMADCKGNLTKIARPGRKTRGPRPRQSKNRSIAPRVHDRWVAGLMLAACTDSAEGHSGPLFVIPTGGRRPERRNLAANGRYVRFETRCLDSATLRST